MGRPSRGGQRAGTGAAVSREATLIRGDGIGPEIVDAVLRVLDAAGAEFDWDEQLAGRLTRLGLKGPLTTPVGSGFRSVNVALRKEFDLYANVRPAKTVLSGGRYDDVDIVLIRKNTEGLYTGMEATVAVAGDPKAVAQSITITTRVGCERVCRFAFEYALAHRRRKVTICHKANILKVLIWLFLEAGRKVSEDYEGRVEVDDVIVDACAMKLVIDPSQFDVIVTTNMFGDILSDEISGLVGGLGLAPGANIGDGCALFEAVHGSAPDIAGHGKANPSALLLAACMMLDYLEERERADHIRAALLSTIRDDNVRTPDLGGDASTMGFADAVSRRLA